MSGPELEPRSVLSQNVILSRTVHCLLCFIPLSEGKKLLNSRKSINYQYLLSPTMIKVSMEIINAPGFECGGDGSQQFMLREGRKEKAGFESQMKRRTAPGG